ncbi:MAG: methyltransferase domain-containing protein [Chloroflexia bacterium]
MNDPLKISAEVQALLVCPACRCGLRLDGDKLVCEGQGRGCDLSFPVVAGVPVLINEANSLFSIADYLERKHTYVKPASRVRDVVGRFAPDLSLNLRGKDNYRKLSRLLRGTRDPAKVLVIGGRVPGIGMEQLAGSRHVELVETDVEFGPRTQVICDAHDLPFADGSFDAVVAQAVLESVVDPYRCVQEMHRILAAGGLIYAETPFMAPVHAGAYDFTRFTHLGHRRLFRCFTEIDSGAVAGTGTALALSLQHFLYSFLNGRVGRLPLRIFSRFAFFGLKYFDYASIRTRGTLDGAAGLYFLGRKSDQLLSDRELVRQYKGIL